MRPETRRKILILSAGLLCVTALSACKPKADDGAPAQSASPQDAALNAAASQDAAAAIEAAMAASPSASEPVGGSPFAPPSSSQAASQTASS